MLFRSHTYQASTIDEAHRKFLNVPVEGRKFISSRKILRGWSLGLVLAELRGSHLKQFGCSSCLQRTGGGGSLSQKLCVSVRSDLYSSVAIATLHRQIAVCVVVCLRPH